MKTRGARGWSPAVVVLGLAMTSPQIDGQGNSIGHAENNKRLFTEETFGGNGRTCLTCHSLETGTVSPQDAAKRFRKNPLDPLFLFDGSDNGRGAGVDRMVKDATILVEIQLPANVSLADDPAARSVVLRREFLRRRTRPRSILF